MCEKRQQCDCAIVLYARVDALTGYLRALADGVSSKSDGIVDGPLYAAFSTAFLRINDALEDFADQHGIPEVGTVIAGMEFAWKKR